MIKFLKGFFFTVGVLLGYMIVFSITNKVVVEKQVQKQGEIALAENDFSHFIPTRYYDDMPRYNFILEDESVSFDVYVYDVATVFRNEDESLSVREGLSFLFVLKSGEIENFQVVKLQLSSYKVIKFRLTKIAKLPIYFLANEENQVQFLKLSDMKDETSYYPLTKVIIDNNGTELSQDLQPLTESEFILREPLESYINSNNEPPNEDYGVVKLTPVFKVDTFGPILLYTALYMLVVAALVFVYFLVKNNKFLGRKKPTEGLQEDIDRVKYNKY